jgi:hypothetical protein
MVKIENRVNFDLYKFPRVLAEWDRMPTRLTGDGLLRHLGFKSATFDPTLISNGWKMSEEDYVWFVLTWS